MSMKRSTHAAPAASFKSSQLMTLGEDCLEEEQFVSAHASHFDEPPASPEFAHPQLPSVLKPLSDNTDNDDNAAATTPTRVGGGGGIKRKFATTARDKESYKVAKSSATSRPHVEDMHDGENFPEPETPVHATPVSHSRSLTRSVSSTLERLTRKRSGSKKHKTTKSFFGSPAKTNAMAGSHLWLDTLTTGESREAIIARLGMAEVNRQEAIYEVTHSEAEYVKDLDNVDKVFQAPIRTLGLMTPEEQSAVFSNIKQLGNAHAQLHARFHAARHPASGVAALAADFLAWLPNLALYEEYCANQAFAKHVLETKRLESKKGTLNELLQNASDLRLSRRMDLWTFLDAPRRRLQRYPLLLGTVLKYTVDPTERSLLEQALAQLKTHIQKVDEYVRKQGTEQLVKLQGSLEFAHSWQKIDLLADGHPIEAQFLANNKDGKDLQLFLFPNTLLVTKVSKSRVNADNEPIRTVVGRPLLLEHVELVDVAAESVSSHAHAGGGLHGPRSSFRGLRNTLTRRLSLSLTPAKDKHHVGGSGSEFDLEGLDHETTVAIRNTDPALTGGSFKKGSSAAGAVKTLVMQLATVDDKTRFLSAVGQGKARLEELASASASAAEMAHLTMSFI